MIQLGPTTSRHPPQQVPTQCGPSLVQSSVVEGKCSKNSVCVCTHMHTHTQNVKLIHQIHMCDHEKTVPHHAPRWGGPGTHFRIHTHWEEARLGLGAAGREADRAAGTEAAWEAGGSGSELLFTTQSLSVVIATQPPNRETDITALRGGRAGGG